MMNREIPPWVRPLFLGLTLLSLLCMVPFFWSVLATIGYVGMIGLDHLFGAGLSPRMPALTWLIDGVVIGIACALWTIAPAYGGRKWRRVILVTPLALVALVAILGLIHRVR